MHRIRTSTYALQMQHPRIRHRLHEIGAGISVQFARPTFIYPFGVDWSNRGTYDEQNRLNHGSRATQNANRVYHYDLAGYRLADYTCHRFVCFTVWCFTFNAYTNQPSRTIDPCELRRLFLKRNELFQKLVLQLNYNLTF